MRTCALNGCKHYTLGRTGKRKTEWFLEVELRDIWKVFWKEVALELRLKLQSEQKANAPNQTIDSLVKSGFCLQTLKEKFLIQLLASSQWQSFSIPLCSDYCSLFSFHNWTTKQPEFYKLLFGLKICHIWHALWFQSSSWLYQVYEISLSLLLSALLLSHFLLSFT